MNIKRLSLLIFVGINLLFSFISCSRNENRFTDEPSVNFQIFNNLNYSIAKGLAGSQQPIPDTLSANTFILPINMNSDTVVYIFDSPVEPAAYDTLTLAYKLHLNPFGSVGCAEEKFSVIKFREVISSLVWGMYFRVVKILMFISAWV